jgi:hypothetical protein
MVFVDDGRALFSRMPVVHLATVSPAGVPVVRTVPAEVDGASLGLRVSPGGAAVASVAETVVSLGTTTYTVEAHAEGMLEPDDALPPSPACGSTARRYRAQLGEDSPLAERRAVIDELWKRGAPGDVPALSMLLARFPELGTPDFLKPRRDLFAKGFRLACTLDGDALAGALDLLLGVYWLCDLPRDVIRNAVLASTAVVVARDGDGRVVADHAVVPSLRLDVDRDDPPQARRRDA